MGYSCSIPLLTGYESILMFCFHVLQIHYTGKHHWVCSTSIGGYVRLFDSGGPSKLTSSLMVQLAECYGCLAENNKLVVEMPPTQKQRGGVNCGLFAIAFATDLAAGNDPTFIKYEQKIMRDHLMACLDRGRLEPFPQKPVYASKKESAVQSISLFCHCCRPECYDNMILCDLCEQWLHKTCESVDEVNSDEEWLCSKCRPLC